MKLWLQRHAPVLCAPGLCYGATDHAAEDEATQAAAAALAAELPTGVVPWTSPLRRCVGLAQALAALRPDLPPARVDARLAEMDFGAWEGQAWQAIARAELEA
ncbi:MAG TPA: histidine phosphatase family protein, partial [Burkholderiaceae bacterium]|nr:histidine phosphatase family protein [Burkholderiaceae bacterium]